VGLLYPMEIKRGFSLITGFDWKGRGRHVMKRRERESMVSRLARVEGVSVVSVVITECIGWAQTDKTDGSCMYTTRRQRLELDRLLLERPTLRFLRKATRPWGWFLRVQTFSYRLEALPLIFTDVGSPFRPRQCHLLSNALPTWATQRFSSTGAEHQEDE
jgi:hypothetical protein